MSHSLMFRLKKKDAVMPNFLTNEESCRLYNSDNDQDQQFFFHFFHLVPIEHCLNTTAYLSIVADHVHPFMTTVYPSSDSYFQQDNAPCYKTQIISDCFLEHEN